MILLYFGHLIWEFLGRALDGFFETFNLVVGLGGAVVILIALAALVLSVVLFPLLVLIRIM